MLFCQNPSSRSGNTGMKFGTSNPVLVATLTLTLTFKTKSVHLWP